MGFLGRFFGRFKGKQSQGGVAAAPISFAPAQGIKFKGKQAPVPVQGRYPGSNAIPGQRGTGSGEGTPGVGLSNKMVSAEEVEGFLDRGEIMFVSSSNVAALQYHKEEESLMVEYLNGAAWLYDPFTRNEALAFAKAFSKGTEIWSRIRVRGPGNKHLHQKNAKRLR